MIELEDYRTPGCWRRVGRAENGAGRRTGREGERKKAFVGCLFQGSRRKVWEMLSKIRDGRAVAA